MYVKKQQAKETNNKRVNNVKEKGEDKHEWSKVNKPKICKWTSKK